jgi:hypothetical protein
LAFIGQGGWHLSPLERAPGTGHADSRSTVGSIEERCQTRCPNTDDAGTDFTIAQYIEADDSELPTSELGRLIRAVRDVPVPGLDLVCMDPSGDLDEVLSARIGQRLENLTAVVVPGLDLPDLRAALAADPAPARRCLLHMDLRPDNILARSSRPAAILDWGNALAGDPALDLARTAEYEPSPRMPSPPTATPERSP